MGRPHGHLMEIFEDQSLVIALTAGAATIDLEFDKSYRHSFAGIEYFSDAGGATPVVPTAGTETYTLTTTVKPSSQQAFSGSVINSADEDQVSWAANVTSVRCVLAAVAGNGATHVRLIVSGNIS